MYDTLDKNNETLNAVSEALKKTIDHFLSADPFYYFAPYFFDGGIDKQCPFFRDNRVTLPLAQLSSSDLKTISYLAPFYRNRVAYNPKNIDYYLRATGWMKYDDTAMDIIVYRENMCGDPSGEIMYQKYLKNPDT